MLIEVDDVHRKCTGHSRCALLFGVEEWMPQGERRQGDGGRGVGSGVLGCGVTVAIRRRGESAFGASRQSKAPINFAFSNKHKTETQQHHVHSLVGTIHC